MNGQNNEEGRFSYLKYIKILSVFLVLIALVASAYITLHLGIFTVQEINISGNTKINEKEILKRSGLRQGESSIFFFEDSVEENILKNSWVKGVSVTKEFPKKVNIQINEEESYCLLFDENGKIFYINKEGKRLGPANFDEGLDFPVLIGEGINDPDLVKEAIQLLELSSVSKVLNWSNISEVHLDSIYGIDVFTVDKKRIEFDTKNIVNKWRKVEKIITHAEIMGIEEKYINITSDNMGVVNFDLPVVKADTEEDG
ncbi:MAG: FtsQ-type POTRA domain-containing protein [Thermodesulfobacteriales bacterium]|nr:MAG: FtsQ-type POTRA domain-containing protein [Thermodesulfobacteriales bacterium]